MRSGAVVSLLVAGALCAGCQLLVTFESVPEGAGGAGGATTTFTEPPGCASDADCDLGSPCTKAFCAAGQCQYDPASDGMPLPDPEPMDCRRPVCQGGEIAFEPAPEQIPVFPDPSSCTIGSCAGDQPQTEPAPDGTPCGQEPVGACKDNVCFGGTCTLQNKPDGTVITPGSEVNCKDQVCQGGQPVLVQNFLNCPDPNPTNCYVPVCDSTGQCISGAGNPAPQGYPCVNAAGMNSTCNGNGACL